MIRLKAYAPLALTAVFIWPINASAEDELQASKEVKETAEQAENAEAEKADSATAAVEQPEESEEQMFCRTVKRVGSHRRVRVCRSTSDIEKSSREAEEFQDGLRSLSPAAGQNLGGGG